MLHTSYVHHKRRALVSFGTARPASMPKVTNTAAATLFGCNALQDLHLYRLRLGMLDLGGCGLIGAEPVNTLDENSDVPSD